MNLAATLRATVLRPRPLLAHAAAWTVCLTATVAMAAFVAEAAFAWAVSPASPFARACGVGLVGVPAAGVPGEAACVPASLFARGRSSMDVVVPPVFAAAVVTGSALFVRALGAWEARGHAEEDRVGRP